MQVISCPGLVILLILEINKYKRNKPATKASLTDTLILDIWKIGLG